MDQEQWQLVKNLFTTAIEAPPEERLDVLRRDCKGDEALYAEVCSLLASSENTSHLIEDQAIDIASMLGAKDDAEQPYLERHFGNYRIIREIGHGGMGTVFLAERDDGEFSKQVALKIVRQSVADALIIERFKRERQILAGLNHPNIAALHDGGVSELGEPFLAMEYVEGESLVEYADGHQLSVNERLRLFLDVCSAVSYAHRHLVVHRDIKPSNILVTSDGVPKLLDFGLAKAFGSDLSKTQTAFRAFTPAYASPEQFQGKPITTASDIYSLGAVFYELLTGIKPIDVENKSFDEALETIGTTYPLRPSAVDSQKVTGSHSLRGDIDNIALKALRKEPERRFKTVEDLADDIERHLAGLPITARPNTTGYLVTKFIQRNKVGVFAAGLVFISLVAGLMISLWQAELAREERDRAEKRFQDVRYLSTSLLFEISPKIERLPGSMEARELLVKRALEYLDSLAIESQHDQTLRFELASAYEKVGDLQGNIDKPNLSDYQGALASLERARTIRGSLPAEPDNLFRLAQNYRVSSPIRHGQNDVTGALSDVSEGRDILAKLAADDPSSVKVQIALIESDLEHGQIYANNNQYAVAVPHFETAVQSLDRLDANSRSGKMLRAQGYSALGNALSWDGRQTEAEAQMKTALQAANELEIDHPNDSEVQAVVLGTYTLASSIYEDSDDQLSTEMAMKALATAKTAARDTADLQAKFNLARAYSRIGISQAKINNLPEAAASLQNAKLIVEELVTGEPRSMSYQRELGKIYMRMGDTHEKKRDLANALSNYEQSAEIFAGLYKGNDLNTLAKRDLAQSLRSVGKTQIALSRIPAARATLLEAKKIVTQLTAAGAMGGYDQQLIDDIDRSLSSI